MAMTGRPPSDDDMRDVFERLDRELGMRSSPQPERTEPPPARPAYVPPRPTMARRSTGGPRVVYVLLGINLLMFVVSYLLAQRIDNFSLALFLLGAKENDAINAGQWWRLLTPMVLHGGLAHLLFNSMALYVLGRDAEQIYGSLRFLIIYVVAGLAGSIASYTFNPQALSVGASGAIFGLLGSLGAFAYAARSFIGREALKTQLGQVATLAVINLMFGFIPGSNIDNSAHIGGLIIGGLCGLLLAPRYRVEPGYITPVVVRRDTGLFSWVGIVVILGGLAAWFVVVLGAFTS